MRLTATSSYSSNRDFNIEDNNASAWAKADHITQLPILKLSTNSERTIGQLRLFS